MSRLLTRWTLVPAVAAISLLTAGAASGHEGHSYPPAAAPVVAAKSLAAGDVTYLVADLIGASEVRSVATTPAGDTDGHGVEIVRIEGNEVRYGIAWENIAAPSSTHIHSGITGVNGPVRVDYFSASTLPSSVRAVVGRVTVADTALLDSIKADPGAFYANIHNAEFPAGAVRGQFRKIDEDVNPDELLDSGFLRARMNGAKEISSTGTPNAGDPNGRGWGAFDASGRRVVFALKWNAIGAPTAAHIHKAPAGSNGNVVVPLFEATAGLPTSIQGVSGVVRNLDAGLLQRIRRNPGNYYANIHNAEFPAGAVRGQLVR